MVKINYDSNFLINQIKPNVNSAIDLLQRAYNGLSGAVMPADFQDKQLYNNLTKQVQDDIKKLRQFNDWIDRCNKIFDNVEANHIKKINMIDGYKINNREKLK